MDNAKQHWPILRELRTELENNVRSFLVFGKDEDEVIVATEAGLGYWIRKMQFESSEESRTATIQIHLDVPELVSMAQGDGHILLLNKRGEIYSMGENEFGQLGLGTVDHKNSFLPQLISNQHKFTSVRCGFYHSMALTEGGKVWAWGSNSYGQVGVSSSTHDSFSSLNQITELDPHRVIEVECGGWHSLALTHQGEVYAWGCNESGQLGVRNESSTHTPTQISTPSPVQSMAAGSIHTLLLTIDGEVYTCGDNGYGQLGLPTTTKSNRRLSKVAGLPFISQIASHYNTNFSIAMSSDHRCYVWGELADENSICTPRELLPIYSTVESPLSFFSTDCSTPHSVTLPVRECSSRTDSTTQTESVHDSVLNHTPPNPILDQMFNNPDSYPDVRFQVGDKTILASRCVLQNSTDHFHRLFSSSTQDLNPPSSVTSQSGPSCPRHTTHNCQIPILIPDYSYPAFHTCLRFLYLGILEVPSEHLADLFLLSALKKRLRLCSQRTSQI